MARLPYLDAVASETLRMAPIVPDMLRTLAEPMQLGPYSLPAGTHVDFAAALVHTRPDLYPEPETFRPERFLERKFGPHEWIPFGGGARRCIGAAFATAEMKVVVGTLREEEPARRNATMGTRHGVVLRVRRRRAAAEAAA
jgi:cytochrome P450